VLGQPRRFAVCVVRRVVLLVLCLIVGGLPLVVYADAHDFQGWVQGVGHISLDRGKRVQLYLEAQPRQGDNWQRFDRLFVRPALAYNVRPDLSFYLGYAWSPAFLDLDLHRKFTDEHRVWEQIVLRHEFDRWRWQQRVRSEQRFIEGVEAVSHRLRYALRGAYSVAADGSWGLSASNEFFVTLNSIDPGPEVGYDRDRVIVGPFWRVGDLRYDLGYVIEQVPHFRGDQRLVQAVLAVISFEL
jgi:hypothetical protein